MGSQTKGDERYIISQPSQGRILRSFFSQLHKAAVCTQLPTASVAFKGHHTTRLVSLPPAKHRADVHVNGYCDVFVCKPLLAHTDCGQSLLFLRFFAE